MTPHNEALKEDIAPICILTGDPLRAKYIAENFLTDYKLVNKVRNMYAYTGFYNGKRVTVFSHGMGMPSMGIYLFELFKFYDVQKVIRVGSCGAYSPDLKMLDTILVDKSYTEGNFAHSLSGTESHLAEASNELNSIIENIALDNNIKITKGNVVCSEVFDYYLSDLDSFLARLPQDLNIIGAEMESFALFYLAKYFNREAACLLTVVDSHILKEQVTPEARENSLNDMIKLALDTTLKI